MAKIATRTLGPFLSSPLGLGMMGHTAGLYGDSVDMMESEASLRKALDIGVTLLNTADFYTSMTSGETHQNIKLLGKVLKDYPREKVIIAMKWGPWVEKGFAPFDLSPESCRMRVDNALKHLGTDYIDILILRRTPRPDKHNTSLEEAAKGMKAVLETGKVKAIGMSEFSAEDVKRAHAIVPVSVLELQLSLFNREAEAELIPLARSIGAGIIAYAPQARGILTGHFDPTLIHKGDLRNIANTHKGDALVKNLELMRRVDKFAKQKGCTVGQLAIAWVLAQGNDVVPIPGTNKTKHLLENMKALDVKLSKEEVQELRDLVPEDEVAGEPQHF